MFATNTGSLTPEQKAFFKDTERYLKQRFGQDQIEFLPPMPLKKLRQYIEEKKIDYFISTAGFSRLISSTGSKELLTYTDNKFPDSQNALGAVFLVRADSGIRDIADLKGKHFSTNWPDAFYTYSVPMGDLFERGYDPEHFFGKLSFIEKTPYDLFNQVLDKKTDVVAMSVCYWEDSAKTDPRVRDLIRPIGVISDTPCARSTRTYPNWAISATANSSPEFTRELVAALLQMPKGPEGQSWSFLTDYSAVDTLFKNLRIGGYSVLRNWSLKTFVKDYSSVIAALGVLLLFLLSITVYLYYQLRLKSGLLVRSLNAQIRTHELARKAQERFDALQKVGAIGQMSSMLAHELRQSIGAIQAYGEGLLRSERKGRLNHELLEEMVNKILAQNRKADEIVERVRTYAKKRKIEKRPASLLSLVDLTVSGFKVSHPKLASDSIEIKCLRDGTALVSSLEMELALTNLIKNAFEAQQLQHILEPKVFIQINSDDDFCSISITDNGSEIDSDLLLNLNTPLSSDKKEGLGLGLAIVKSIAINHGGRLLLEKNGEHGGLKATLLLPRYREPSPQAGANALG